MDNSQALMTAIFDGWHVYQFELTKAIAPLDAEQLLLPAAPGLRTVGHIATHVIGARARWFHMLLGEGGDVFKELGGWDRHDQPARTAEELVYGLETTWAGMHEAIGRWTPGQWADTWPGEDDDPAIITRQWVIWHLLEHDLHHGGEISLTLGANGIQALQL